MPGDALSPNNSHTPVQNPKSIVFWQNHNHALDSNHLWWFYEESITVYKILHESIFEDKHQPVLLCTYTFVNPLSIVWLRASTIVTQHCSLGYVWTHKVKSEMWMRLILLKFTLTFQFYGPCYLETDWNGVLSIAERFQVHLFVSIVRYIVGIIMRIEPLPIHEAYDIVPSWYFLICTFISTFANKGKHEL